MASVSVLAAVASAAALPSAASAPAASAIERRFTPSSFVGRRLESVRGR
jgi:hypothetical protein